MLSLLASLAILQPQLATSHRPPTEPCSSGAAWDVFTVGFYLDIEHFASTPDLPPGTFERAAMGAGFESRGGIGMYLRTLIDEHHGTLASRVDP